MHDKKWTCTKSSSFSQFLTFYYCCTIYTSTYNFECINFPYLFFVFVLNERVAWKYSSSETMRMRISTVVAMDADWEIIFFFFCFVFSLDQKDRNTGSPNHRHAIYWVKRGRETEPSGTQRSSSVRFCYSLTSAGRKTLRVSWMKLKSL